MKRILKGVIAISLCASLLNASKYQDVADIDYEDRTKLRSPLENILKSHDLKIFLVEFEIKRRSDTCGSGMDLALGFDAHMIEILGYSETSKKPLYFPFADLDLGGNVLKSCSSRASNKEESGRDSCQFQHMIYFPLFSLIFKKKLSFLCFHDGSLSIPIISEFDPTHLKDIYSYKLIPHMIAMFNPVSLIATILNCAATTSYSAITGYSSGEIEGTTNEDGTVDTTESSEMELNEWAEGYEEPDIGNSQYTSYNSLQEKGIQALSFIRNSMFYNVGCNGFAPVGGYVRGQDPGVDNVLLTYGATSKIRGFSALTTLPLLQKQTNLGMEISSKTGLSAIPNTMCEAKNFPIAIEDDTVLQRAFPTVGKGKEQGESGMMVTTLANVPGSQDAFVNVFWQRRDYLAFAYNCKASLFSSIGSD